MVALSARIMVNAFHLAGWESCRSMVTVGPVFVAEAEKRLNEDFGGRGDRGGEADSTWCFSMTRYVQG
jgi:hypothetical protein